MRESKELSESDELSRAGKYTAYWWAAAGIFVALTPIFRLLDPVLPLERVVETNATFGRGFMRLLPDAIRAFGSLVCVIVYVVTIAQRFQIRRATHDKTVRRAIFSFVYGVAAAIGYWMASQNVPHLVTTWVGTLSEAGVALLYILFYMFITRGFALLAMNDYVNPSRVRQHVNRP